LTLAQIDKVWCNLKDDDVPDNEMESAVAKTTRFSRLLICLLATLIIFSAHDAQARTHRRSSRSHHSVFSAITPHYASVIMDAQSGRVLSQESANTALPPASLTKLMTLFMTFEALENGRLHMDKYLDISQNAINQKPSKLGLRMDTRITVKEAIYVVVTRSANDVAVALAETIGGSTQNFTRMMNARARSLGMRNTYFNNPSGLPDPMQKSSAMDMAILARAIMQYFPQHYHVFNTIRYNYRGQIIETHNNLMRRFKGMDGLKTGYTYASGFNLVASSVRNNKRVIVVVFGGRTAVARDNHVAELMNQGLAMLERGKQTTQVAAAQPAPQSTLPAVTQPAPVAQLAAAPQTPVATQTTPVAAPATAVTTVTAPVATTAVTPPATIATQIPQAPAAAVTAPVTATAPVATPAEAAPQPAAAPVTVASNTKATAVSKTKAKASKKKSKKVAKKADATEADSDDDDNWQPDGGHVRPLGGQVAQNTLVQNAAYQPAAGSTGSKNWGIQIGAYDSARLGQQKLQAAQAHLRKILPETGQPVVIPVETASGTLYRARLLGLSPQSANKACHALSQCMAFAMR